MADNDILLKLKLLDEYSAELKKFVAEMKQSGKAVEQTSGKVGELNLSFGKLKAVAAVVAGSAVLGAVAKGLVACVNAAAESEAANVKLIASLKATGQFSEQAVQGIDAWAGSLMAAIGVTDDLAKSLVADAIAKGKNVEQSQRLIEAAANMAPVVGSVEGAMQLLTRASNGSLESLKRYGIQVTEAEQKSGDFEAVLQRVEKQFSGQAAAAMSTYAGRLNEAKDAWGETAEMIGEKFLPALTDAIESWRDFLNEYVRGISVMESMNAQMAGDNPLMKAAQEYDAASRLFEKSKKAYLQAVDLGDESRIAGFEKNMVAAGQALQNAFKTLKTEQFFIGVDSTKEDKSKFENTKTGTKATEKLTSSSVVSIKLEQAAIKLEEDAKRLAASITLTTRAELKRAGETYQEKLQDEMQERLTGGEEFGPTFDPLADMIGSYENSLAALTSADEDRLRAQKDITEEEVEASKDRTKKLDDATKAAIEKQQEIDRIISNIGNAFISSIQSGDFSTVIFTGLQEALAKGIEKQFGASASTSGTYASIILSIVSTLDVEAKRNSTAGGQARSLLKEKLSEVFDYFKDEGFTGLELNLKDALTDIELDATGRADFWNDIAEQITGVSGGGQGNILAAQFEDLNLTTAQTVDALGNLIAQANGLSEAEGDQAAAAAALLSITEFTSSELADLAQLYGDSSNIIERRAELEDQILEQAQAYADATGSAKTDALADLEASRAEYLALLVSEADAAAKSDAELVAALEGEGMSAEEAKELVNSQKSAEEIAAKQLTVLEAIAAAGGISFTKQHSGSYPGSSTTGEYVVRDRSELVVPNNASSFREARDYLNSALGDSGGSRTIVLQLDGKTVAKVVDGHTRAMRRTKEVAA